MYYNKSLKDYVDDLSSRLPAPGGGSAAALSASLGAALISMVINFTLGKAKYAKYQKDLSRLFSSSEKIRKRLLELVDLDVEAYRSKDINRCLRVPLEVSRLCAEAMGLCTPLLKKGNINLISDVAVAAILLEAGFSSALFNVNINLKYLRDKPRARKLRNELNKKRRVILRARHNLEVRVDAVIRG